MARVSIKELNSLFVLRHAQRNDKVASTISSIDFPHHNGSNRGSQESGYMLSDSYNAPLATFENTSNKSNNGYVQATEMGTRLLSYIYNHVDSSIVVLKFHSSPYLRCIQTIKYLVDQIVKKHKKEEKLIKIVISIDQFLSEWLSSDLDINFYPPNDHGATLLETAIQYLSSNIPFNRNPNVDIILNLHESYKHGNPGAFSEGLMHQYSRLSNGLISVIKHESNNLSKDADSTDIVLLMTHGACVRSLVSKLMGKSLFVEIPLASMTISKPVTSDSRHYIWQLVETDIEIKDLKFDQVDIYSLKDPFEDLKTTFQRDNTSLDFKTNISTSKSKLPNKSRSQSLLAPKLDADSDSDSDNEGLSFIAQPRHDNQRRFRSASLFGPVLKNPFFSEPKQIEKSKDFINPKLSAIDQEDKIISPIENLSITDRRSRTPKYQNIDINDGAHHKEHSNEKVPALDVLSSNNSSSNSLHDDLSACSGELPKLSESSSALDTNPNDDYATSHSSAVTLKHAQASRSISTPHLSSSPDKTLNTKQSSLFDKSLIEQSLNAYHRSKEEAENATRNTTNCLSFTKPFPKPPADSNAGDQQKFKIDLFEKKSDNKYKLNLYGDSDEESEGFFGGNSSGWFLGSNR